MLPASVCAGTLFCDDHLLAVLGQGAPVLHLAESVSQLDAETIPLRFHISELFPALVPFASNNGQPVLRHRAPTP